MKVVDAFTFFNEVDMLELRLRELDDVVDIFLIVESPETHAGRPKPSYYVANESRYAKWQHKIRVVAADLPENPKDAWDREMHQRDAIAQHLTEFEPTDLLLVSDVDEIPDPKVVRHLLEDGPLKHPVVHFLMDFYYYSVEYLNPLEQWIKAFACPVGVARCLPSLSFIRNNPAVAYNKKGGWHLSYFGNAEFICNKITEFAHQELNTPEKKASVAECLERGVNFVNGKELVHIPPTQNAYLPTHVHEIRFSASG